MNVKRTILFLTAAALLTGCFKDVSTKTNYVIKPLVQDLSGDPYLALEGVKAYLSMPTRLSIPSLPMRMRWRVSPA